MKEFILPSDITSPSAIVTMSKRWHAMKESIQGPTPDLYWEYEQELKVAMRLWHHKNADFSKLSKKEILAFVTLNQTHRAVTLHRVGIDTPSVK